MSDEEDYMSLKFLEEAESFEEKKKESYSERRKRQLREQAEKAYIKPLREREEEEREKGFQKSVDNSNKGMQMLMKMGFKKGDALGKDRADGIVEPIQVDLKSDRMGLGMGSVLKKRLREEEEEFEKKKAHIDVEDFRVIKARLNEESKRTRYLVAAISVCQTLDEESDIKENILWLLKPGVDEQENKEVPVDEKEENDEEKEKEDIKQSIYTEEEVEALKSLPVAEKLERAIDYLREKYAYCFWCRAKYTDKEDLDQNCPGREEEDH